jgi:hypothetical protein
MSVSWCWISLGRSFRFSVLPQAWQQQKEWASLSGEEPGRDGNQEMEKTKERNDRLANRKSREEQT